MPVSITRNSKAPTIDGVSAGQSYESLGFTDGNIVILADNGQFLTVPFGLISPDGDWSVATDKPARKKVADPAASDPAAGTTADTGKS